MLAISYNYAIYTEITFGRRTWQAHGSVPGAFPGTVDWLPLADPQDNEQDAKLDAFVAHKQLQKLGVAPAVYKLDPTVRTFDWSGPRRILK